MKKLVRPLIVVALVLVPVALVAQDKVDITGKWVFQVETSAGTGTPTVTFNQDGEKLSCHYSSMTLGEADFTGTIKGREITFNFNADVGGMQIPV